MREWKHEIRKRLAGSNLLPEREAEIIDELSAHLQDQYSQFRAGGATDEEAFAGEPAPSKQRDRDDRH